MRVSQQKIPQLCLVIICFLLTSCLSNSLSDSEEPEDPSVSPPVPADHTLEAVTWNLEWYGSASHGPDNENLQTDNIIEVMDSLRADLYALQEIYGQEDLNKLLSRLSGYRGFVANHVGWNQKMAFIFNTATIDSVSSGAITEGQDEYDWASGRFPLFFRFTYTYNSTTVPVYAVVIHAKANTGNAPERQQAYERRRRAADSLHVYLQDHEPAAHVILLGDYNDDVDVTIYDGSSSSPYEVFVKDTTYFKAVTQSISAKGQSSYVADSYSDLIDHIIISDELFPLYISSSEEIFFDALDFIPQYSTTTSDHLPVWVKFDVTRMQ